MTHIAHNAPHPGSLFAGEPAQPASRSLGAGDLVVFDGNTLQVLASGRLSLPDGPVEVAHVQAAEGPPQGAADTRSVALDAPASLVRKLAEHLGAAEGAPYQLKPGDAALIDQVCTDYALLMAGANFRATAN